MAISGLSFGNISEVTRRAQLQTNRPITRLCPLEVRADVVSQTDNNTINEEMQVQQTEQS